MIEVDGYSTLPVEQHLNCSCRCVLDPVDCRPPLHHYDADTCHCRCHNESLALTCPRHKLWDERTCSCVCRHVTRCLDDEVFDFVSCTYASFVWLNGLMVSALGIRARGPGFDSWVVPPIHWVATLGKLFTHSFSAPRNWSTKRVFGALVVMVNLSLVDLAVVCIT